MNSIDRLIALTTCTLPELFMRLRARREAILATLRIRTTSNDE